jgi:hypothetical protein
MVSIKMAADVEAERGKSCPLALKKCRGREIGPSYRAVGCREKLRQVGIFERVWPIFVTTGAKSCSQLISAPSAKSTAPVAVVWI